MLDSVTGTQFRQLPGVKGMVEKAAMELFGNGLTLFSRLMDSYPRNYILGTIFILDLNPTFCAFYGFFRWEISSSDGRLVRNNP